MQVILLQDVERVGHEGDLLTVADGYARNYLLPRGLAVQANKGTLKDLELRRGAIARRDAEKREAAQQVAEALRDKTIVVKAVTGEGTKLHGTITAQQIAEAAAQQLSLSLDKRDIDIAEPIREVGDYLVSARLYKDVAAQLPVRVVSEKQAASEEVVSPPAPTPEVAQEPAPETPSAQTEGESGGTIEW